ncbi:MAG: hypothetical protein JWL63_2402 [Rhodocyclales bacterium]|nr:hypothetical protein [Rhodocyclales bacterium]
MKDIKLYSPMQAAIGTLFTGPLAAVYFIKANFIALGEEDQARSFAKYGLIVVGLFVIVLPFLPEKFPGAAIPAALSTTTYQLIKRYQASKDKIKASDELDFQPMGRVLFICVKSFILFAMAAIVWLLIVHFLGLAKL